MKLLRTLEYYFLRRFRGQKAVVQEGWYLEQYPDVGREIEQGSFLNADHHYLRHGFGEMRQPVAPVATSPHEYVHIDMVVPIPGHGLYVMGWFVEQERSLISVQLESSSPEERVPRSRIPRMPKPDARRYLEGKVDCSTDDLGFHCLIPAEVSTDEDASFVVEVSWEGHTLHLMPDRVLSCEEFWSHLLGMIQPGDGQGDLLWEHYLVPALRGVQSALPSEPVEPKMKVYGSPVHQPEVTLILLLDHAQLPLKDLFAVWSNDPALDAVEVLFVLQHPQLEEQVIRMAENLSAVYGRPFSLLLPPRDLPASEALNLGARLASSDLLGVVSPHTLPAGPGWLQELRDALQKGSGSGVAGAVLLGPEGQECQVPTLPGVEALPPICPRGAWLMAREVFEKAGGCDGGYITEEYSVMDLWVRLGETGAPVHQEPEARLFYLPSESVLDQPGLFAPEHRERNDSWLFAYLRGVPG